MVLSPEKIGTCERQLLKNEFFLEAAVPSILSDSTMFFAHLKTPGHPERRQKNPKKCL